MDSIKRDFNSISMNGHKDAGTKDKVLIVVGMNNRGNPQWNYAKNDLEKYGYEVEVISYGSLVWDKENPNKNADEYAFVIGHSAGGGAALKHFGNTDTPVFAFGSSLDEAHYKGEGHYIPATGEFDRDWKNDNVYWLEHEGDFAAEFSHGNPLRMMYNFMFNQEAHNRNDYYDEWKEQYFMDMFYARTSAPMIAEGHNYTLKGE